MLSIRAALAAAIGDARLSLGCSRRPLWPFGIADRTTICNLKSAIAPRRGYRYYSINRRNMEGHDPYKNPYKTHMSDNTIFGRWLKQRRRALDLTQERLAQQVGCAVITLQKIEAGSLRPSTHIAERLAERLDVPPEERASFVQAARA